MLAGTNVKNALNKGAVYDAFQFAVSRFGWTRWFYFTHYIPYMPGVRILDLGCGPGSCAKYFKHQDYVGVDIDERYIREAKEKYPQHRFEHSSLSALAAREDMTESFDLVMCAGLFHHLDDATGQQYVQEIEALLADRGKVVIIEPLLHDGQTRLKKSIMLSDRGEHLREIDGYRRLFEAAESVTWRNYVEEDRLAIPYTHGVFCGTRRA